MKITEFLTDDAVLAELGARIASRRVELQLTQTAAAEQAGIAKRTPERLEAGQSSQLLTLVRVLRALERRAMSTLTEVRLCGRTIGAISLLNGEDVACVKYDAEFAQSGIQMAPIAMPLSRRTHRFPELPRRTFLGLPGLLADSLPDKFGNALINAWLASQGRQPDSFNAVERLCYAGERGMGALEFAPVVGPRATQTADIEAGKLMALASEILTQRNRLQAFFAGEGTKDAMKDILCAGTSAGGARAKAVIVWNPETDDVRSGQIQTGDGMIEYAYYLMARECGIDISASRLFKENGRAHSMTRRFDRLANGEKLRMQSLCALAHYDVNCMASNSGLGALSGLADCATSPSTASRSVCRSLLRKS